MTGQAEVAAVLADALCRSIHANWWRPRPPTFTSSTPMPLTAPCPACKDSGPILAAALAAANLPSSDGARAALAEVERELSAPQNGLLGGLIEDNETAAAVRDWAVAVVQLRAAELPTDPAAEDVGGAGVGGGR